MKKRLLACTMAILLILGSICVAFADNTGETTGNTSTTGTTGSDQVNNAVSSLNDPNASGAYKTLQEIMNYMAWIGFAIAIFKVIQIGIMFMMGVGSRKSDAKSALLPWFIGAAICAMFGTLGPWFIGMIAQGDTGNIFDA